MDYSINNAGTVGYPLWKKKNFFLGSPPKNPNEMFEEVQRR